MLPLFGGWRLSLFFHQWPLCSKIDYLLHFLNQLSSNHQWNIGLCISYFYKFGLLFTNSQSDLAGLCVHADGHFLQTLPCLSQCLDVICEIKVSEAELVFPRNTKDGLVHRSLDSEVRDHQEEEWWQYASLPGSSINVKGVGNPTYSPDATAGIQVEVPDDVDVSAWDTIRSHDVPWWFSMNGVKGFIKIYEVYCHRLLEFNTLLDDVP